MSKSRPLYGPLRRDATGRRHLLVLQDAATAAQALDAFQGGVDEGGLRPEVWTVDASARPAQEADRRFDAAPALLDGLRDRLRTETMGLRLYAVGEETFLWDLFGVASAAGLGRQEVVLSRIGRPSRRVSCVHCATMNEDVRTDHVVCRGCGATLAVRDHFSRRLSAYMGVQADAEAPGELPATQALAS